MNFFLSIVLVIVSFSAHGFTLSRFTPVDEILNLAAKTHPKTYSEFEKDFVNLAQMCRHAHNIRFPSRSVETKEPTPDISINGVTTKNKALLVEHQLTYLSENINKDLARIEAKVLNLFEEQTCTESLFQFRPEMIILSRFKDEIAELKYLIEDEDFIGCSQFIEQRLDRE